MNKQIKQKFDTYPTNITQILMGPTSDIIPMTQLKHCLSLALKYHSIKKSTHHSSR
ncbi:protein of unknown function [Shewanella benthica]|uniref:Uncharacterized protein n=1 Tax=Shewanella benthica TaxID=43661 RepID=A0A330M6V0_9GAMM|nr:protein of unknown function [Shewanella benthica]